MTHGMKTNKIIGRSRGDWSSKHQLNTNTRREDGKTSKKQIVICLPCVRGQTIMQNVNRCSWLRHEARVIRVQRVRKMKDMKRLVMAVSGRRWRVGSGRGESQKWREHQHSTSLFVPSLLADGVVVQQYSSSLKTHNFKYGTVLALVVGMD